MNIARAPANGNNHQLIWTRYAKFCSHLLIKYQAAGQARAKATATSTRKSVDNSLMILVTDAPTTFRIPISLVLLSTINAVRPNRPRQAMIMATLVMYRKTALKRCSDRYWFAKVSSRNEYWNGLSGINFFQLCSSEASVERMFAGDTFSVKLSCQSRFTTKQNGL